MAFPKAPTPHALPLCDASPTIPSPSVAQCPRVRCACAPALGAVEGCGGLLRVADRRARSRTVTVWRAMEDCRALGKRWDAAVREAFGSFDSSTRNACVRGITPSQETANSQNLPNPGKRLQNCSRGPFFFFGGGTRTQSPPTHFSCRPHTFALGFAFVGLRFAGGADLLLLRHLQIVVRLVDLQNLKAVRRCGLTYKYMCASGGGGGGVGTRPWWLALLACGSAYQPLAFEPSAMTSRRPHYCGHPHCRGGGGGVPSKLSEYDSWYFRAYLHVRLLRRECSTRGLEGWLPTR